MSEVITEDRKQLLRTGQVLPKNYPEHLIRTEGYKPGRVIGTGLPGMTEAEFAELNERSKP